MLLIYWIYLGGPVFWIWVRYPKMIEFPGTICWNIWCLLNKYNLWTIDTTNYFLHLAYLAPILSSLELIHKHKTKKRDHSGTLKIKYNRMDYKMSQKLLMFKNTHFIGTKIHFSKFVWYSTQFSPAFRDFWPYKKCRIFFNFMPKDFLVTDACQLKCKGRWHIKNWQISRFLYSGWLC